jgi:hypothetical protein
MGAYARCVVQKVAGLHRGCLFVSISTFTSRESFFPAESEKVANKIIDLLSHFHYLFAANATHTAIPESNGPTGYCNI